MDSRLPKLTPAARLVLRWLADNEHEDDLLCEGIHCWYGPERTSWRVVKQLLNSVLISPDTFSEQTSKRFTINESGKRYLKNLPPYRDSDGKYFWDFYQLVQDHPQ